LLTRKTKNIIPAWIDSARGLDYLSLEEYFLIPFSMTVTIIWNRVETPVLLFVIFRRLAYANNRVQFLLHFLRLR